MNWRAIGIIALTMVLGACAGEATHRLEGGPIAKPPPPDFLPLFPDVQSFRGWLDTETAAAFEARYAIWVPRGSRVKILQTFSSIPGTGGLTIPNVAEVEVVGGARAGKRGLVFGLWLRPFIGRAPGERR